jgi:hypothetical protein
MPLEIRDIIKQVRKGKIVLNTHQMGFDGYRKQLDFIANRMVLAIIIGALIISAGMIIHYQLERRLPGCLEFPISPFFFWL